MSEQDTKSPDALDNSAPLWALELKTHITTQFHEIEKKLDDINSRLEEIHSQTEKMDGHVDFVENVYTTVKAPLSFVCSAVNRMSKIKELPSTQLPQIESSSSSEPE